MAEPDNKPLPGSVYWCDGGALSFEPHFKRRPVLVVGDAEEGIAVIPLSHRRHYGQEVAVTHSGGTSYLTGTVLVVEESALQKPLGHWEGFATWQQEQTSPPRAGRWWTKLLAKISIYHHV